MCGIGEGSKILGISEKKNRALFVLYVPLHSHSVIEKAVFLDPYLEDASGRIPDNCLLNEPVKS